LDQTGSGGAADVNVPGRPGPGLQELRTQPVWSSVVAPAECFFTDSILFWALALVSWASPVAMTCPLLALS